MVDLKASLERARDKAIEQEKLQKKQKEIINKIISPCTWSDICEITEQDEIDTQIERRQKC